MTQRTRIALMIVSCALPFMLVTGLSRAEMTSSMVRMSDDVFLATDIYTPDGEDGPWPVILIRTPYSKSGLSEFGLLAGTYGFAAVAQDTRGRFMSQGTDTVFFDDGTDGRATLEWIAGQDFCDGNIGTFGASALGITQLLMAPGAPAGLKCQFIMVATPDMYGQGIFQGGSFRTYMIETWLAGQGSSYVLPGWESNYLLSDYWDPIRIVERYGDVNVPALHLGGWFDIFTQGTIDAFTGYGEEGGDGAAGNQYMMIGPWTHSTMGTTAQGELEFPEDSVMDGEDLTYIVFTWFNHCLKGIDNDVEHWPAAMIYTMGDVDDAEAPGNEWVQLDAWPPDAAAVPYYLRGDGSLSEEPPGDEGSTAYFYDPADPVPTLCGPNLTIEMHPGPCDQTPLLERGDVLMFETGVLAEAVEVTGRITARLLVSSDAPDTDFTAKLIDVYPDGRRMLIADGILRVRHRGGQDSEQFMEPGEVYEINADLWSTSLIFNTGHRISVQISSSNSPRFDPNPNTGLPFRTGETVFTATNTVHHNRANASAVLLPIAGHPPVEEPEPEAVEQIEPVLEPDPDESEPVMEPIPEPADTADAPADNTVPDVPDEDEASDGCSCHLAE